MQWMNKNLARTVCYLYQRNFFYLIDSQQFVVLLIIYKHFPIFIDEERIPGQIGCRKLVGGVNDIPYRIWAYYGFIFQLEFFLHSLPLFVIMNNSENSKLLPHPDIIC